MDYKDYVKVGFYDKILESSSPVFSKLIEAIRKENFDFLKSYSGSFSFVGMAGISYNQGEDPIYEYGDYLLYEAIVSPSPNAPEIVELLLDKGLNPNSTIKDYFDGSQWVYPLNVAFKFGRCEIASLLLERGAHFAIADIYLTDGIEASNEPLSIFTKTLFGLTDKAYNLFKENLKSQGYPLKGGVPKKIPKKIPFPNPQGRKIVELLSFEDKRRLTIKTLKDLKAQEEASLEF